MTSILTNTAAMSALQALATTQRALATTQAQVSSGLAVATASDGAAQWSIATAMRSRVSALSAAGDAAALGLSVVDVAYQGLTSIIGDLSKMKALVVEAQSVGMDRSAIDTSMVAYEQSIRATAQSASFNGLNLLQTDVNSDVMGTYVQTARSTTSVVTGLSGSSVSAVDVALQVPLYAAAGPVNGQSTNYGLFDYLNYTNGNDGSDIPTHLTQFSGYSISNMRTSSLSGNAGYAADIPTMLREEEGQIDEMVVYLGGYAARLGGERDAISATRDYDSALSDALISGVGSLVDADMNVASTRLQALQTQQQLGVQALSIANGDGRLILKLFGQT